MKLRKGKKTCSHMNEVRSKKFIRHKLDIAKPKIQWKPQTQLISVQERKDWGCQFITKEMNPNFSKDPNCTEEST